MFFLQWKSQILYKYAFATIIFIALCVKSNCQAADSIVCCRNMLINTWSWNEPFAFPLHWKYSIFTQHHYKKNQVCYVNIFKNLFKSKYPALRLDIRFTTLASCWRKSNIWVHNVLQLTPIKSTRTLRWKITWTA